MTSSIPCFYSDYDHFLFRDEFSEVITSNNYPINSRENYSCGTNGSIFYGADHGNLQQLPHILMFDASHENISPPVPITTSFHDQLGLPRDLDLLTAPRALFDHNGTNGLINDVVSNQTQTFNDGLQLLGGRDETCYGFSTNFDFSPVCTASLDQNWGIECNNGNIGAATEHMNNIQKVGRYTLEERKNKILKYQKKRNRRNFNKTIKYACRKTLADRRVRIRGRFAKYNELSEDGSCKKINHKYPQANETYSSDSANEIIKNDDDDRWLQEAVASLMYAPCISGILGE